MPRKFVPKEQEAQERRKLDTANLPKLRDTDPKDILLRYLSDESTRDIAADYGVTTQYLGRYLIKHAEEDWKDAQVARAIARKERAEDGLETANDPLSLAKARELLKAAQWDLERVCKRIYGEDKANLNLSITPTLTILVSKLEGNTIEQNKQD